MNVIIEIKNARWKFLGFLEKHRLVFERAYQAMRSGTITKMYYVHSTPTRAGYMGGFVYYGDEEPTDWKGVHASVEEFIQYYEGTTEALQTMDTKYMPTTAGPEDFGKCSTTVTRDPDSGKVTSLHTKFLPPMNAYNTLVIKKDTTFGTVSAQKKPKPSELVIIPFEVRLSRSEENVRAELLRLIPEDVDVDDVTILIEPIF